MPIINSCCFWNSLKNGCYASALYTLTYYAVSFFFATSNVYDEQEFLRGEKNKPSGESLLEPESISPTIVHISICLSITSALGCLSSILLLIGLYYDQRQLLIPWIFTLILDLILQIAQLIYLLVINTLKFEPLVALIITIDMFIMCLNIYSLICIISQYQVYRFGYIYRKQQILTCQITDPLTTRPTSSSSHKKIVIASPLVHTNFTIIPEEPSQLNDSTIDKV